jgi:hypothetical protein
MLCDHSLVAPHKMIKKEIGPLSLVFFKPMVLKVFYSIIPIGSGSNQLKLLISENIYNFYIVIGNPVKQYFNIRDLIFLDKKYKMNTILT